MLELVFDDGGKERVAPLRGGALTLGSGPACDFVLPQRGINHRHARIVTRDDESRLTDLGSERGTR